MIPIWDSFYSEPGADIPTPARPKPYLVRANVESTLYMGPSTNDMDIRIVFAENEEQAKEKYRQFWYNKNDAYAVDYEVHDIVVTEPLI